MLGWQGGGGQTKKQVEMALPLAGWPPWLWDHWSRASTTVLPSCKSKSPTHTQLLQQLSEGLQPQVTQLLVSAPEGHLCPLPAVMSSSFHTVDCKETNTC